MTDDRAGTAATEEMEALFASGGEYAEVLLAENERLRGQIAEREAANRSAADGETPRLPRQLKSAVATLEEERRTLRGALVTAETANRRLAERFVEVETEGNTLGSLYVATHQLHSTLDLNALYRTLVEVGINLIGAEVLAVYAFDEKRRKLVATAAEGARLDCFPIVELGSGVVGEAVATGKLYLTRATGSSDLACPIICIPFRRETEPAGAMAIYRLLRQKAGLTPLDHELFSLLAGHAAAAIYAARLYTESKRKLDTMEGFLQLMRPVRGRDL